MNPGTTIEGVTPIRGSRRLLLGREGIRDRLICTLVVLPLVMSVSSTAQPNELEPVDDALVLYVGRNVPENGGDVVDTIDEVISKDVLGETLVYPEGNRKEPPVRFREAFPDVACFGAWLPSFEGLNRARRLGHQAPTFFKKLKGYRSEGDDLQLCSVAQGPEAPGEPVTNSAHLALEISDTERPDWDAIDYHLARKLGEFVPREGESFSISALICPRILQIRTPVRAAVRTRKHAERMVERLRRVAAKIQEPRDGLHPMIKAAVVGTPTVYFTDDADDFTDNQQYEYNLFDIFFERASHIGGSASDAVAAEHAADSCVSRGVQGRPANLNAELNLDQSLRFVWDFAGSEIPSPSEAPLIQKVLDELAGCEPQAQAATDLEVDENETLPEPVEGTEHEGDPSVYTDATQKEPVEATEHVDDSTADTDSVRHDATERTGHEGDPSVRTDATPKEPAEVTEQADDSSTGTDAARQDAAQGCKAKTETPDKAIETLHVIEGYEDLDPIDSISIRVENRSTATKRAEAVRGLFDEGTNARVTGFGIVEDFTAVDLGRAVKVEGDETFALEPQQLREGKDVYNRTAFVTVLRVPEALADETSLMAATLETRRDGYAFTLAKVRATTQSCVSDGMIRPIRGDLASYPTYFLGKHYEPFKLLPEHKQAVILVCGGHGPHGALTSGQMGPALLRALHEHDSRMFQKDNPHIRATYLHKIGEGDARRYYLFGDSILTHFKDDTKAGVLQAGEKSLCNTFPGLRIHEKGTERDFCARNSPTSFTEKASEIVHRALFDLVLPTTLADQLACAPILVDKPAESPTNDSSTATTSAKSASHRPPGCPEMDVLQDPHELLKDLKERTYVFRAAIDVAYEFRRRQ